MKKFVSLLLILVLALTLGVGALAVDYLELAEADLRQAQEDDNAGFYLFAAEYYYSAADIYKFLEMYQEARDAYENAQRCFILGNDEEWAGKAEDNIKKIDNWYLGTGSTLSQGTLAIVTAVAGVAVGLGGGWLLFGRKKKTGEE